MAVSRGLAAQCESALQDAAAQANVDLTSDGDFRPQFSCGSHADRNEALVRLTGWIGQHRQVVARGPVQPRVVIEKDGVTENARVVQHAEDPRNRLLASRSRQRLDAEAIQDTMSFLSGGNSRPAVYTKIIRNRLDPFLTAFNAPIPTLEPS